jgi:hypothetical protein
MTVKISKPAINVREELADLKKPTGIAGEAMLRAETPQEQFNLIGAGRRNMLINGDMRIAQRGTTFGNPQSYTLDRYKSLRYAAADYTISQQTAGLDQFQYCIRAQRNSGTSQVNSFAVNQPLEVKDSYALRGQMVTFSIYLRAGSDYSCSSTTVRVSYHNTAGEYGVNYGNFTVASYNSVEETLDLRGQTTWKLHTFTGLIPSNAVQVCCSIQANAFSGTAGSNDYVETTGWQLEVGKVATPFEHRSYGEELAACQRYYYKSTASIYLSGQTYAANNSVDGMRVPWNFPVVMRANPATSVSGGNDGGSNATLSIIADSPEVASLNLISTNSYKDVWWQSGSITADAEL